MELVYYFLLIAVTFTNLGFGQDLGCENISVRSGFISESHDKDIYLKKCWKFEVPQGIYLRLNLTSLDLFDLPCSNVFVQISVLGSNEVIRFCSNNSTTKSILALNDAEVTCSLKGKILIKHKVKYRKPTLFSIDYHSESLICAQKDNFRCSEYDCIHQYQVCDGIENCENGTDEIDCETSISSINGVKESRSDALAWLKSQRSDSFGWKKNTHRAITVLYLTGEAQFTGDDLQQELMVKELELHTLAALLRNSTDPLWTSDISMYVNALSATCHNPRQLYGHNLVQILAEKVSSTTSQRPGACLTLCNANWTLPESNVRGLLKLLSEDSKFPFIQDIQAMAVMALTCIKKKTNSLERIENATEVFDATIKTFIASQHSNGSFGNIYTTAIVTQALLANGQEDNILWNHRASVNFLMQELNVTRNFLATYLVLPILNGRSLVDLGSVNCAKSRENLKQDISDVTNKLGNKIQIQYSLYVGDLKDVIHTTYLRVSEKSSYFDVMRIAQEVDPKYKFLHRQVAEHVYVYDIDGIINDPETSKFWILFTAKNNGSLLYHSQSPDQLTVREGDHLIMWYKTLSI